MRPGGPAGRAPLRENGVGRVQDRRLQAAAAGLARGRRVVELEEGEGQARGRAAGRGEDRWLVWIRRGLSEKQAVGNHGGPPEGVEFDLAVVEVGGDSGPGRGVGRAAEGLAAGADVVPPQDQAAAHLLALERDAEPAPLEDEALAAGEGEELGGA